MVLIKSIELILGSWLRPTQFPVLTKKEPRGKHDGAAGGHPTRDICVPATLCNEYMGRPGE